MSKILITGGAGFIGSHTADYFIDKGFEVNVIDNLSESVHLKNKKPSYLNKKVKYFFGDLRDENIIQKAIKDVSYIINDYSLVGTGISMYDFNNFFYNNIVGTTNLWNVIIKNKIKIKRFIQASSVSVYGEGKYVCKKHGIYYPNSRIIKKNKKNWQISCPRCKNIMTSKPTHEKSPKNSNSIYSLTKQHQEEISLMIGANYGIETIICRYFNCYGSRLSFNNPYTGVTSIFLNSLLQNKKPIIFEDGNQVRDYIHISDLVRSKYLLLTKSKLKHNIFNIGSGKPINLLKIVKILNKINNSSIEPMITNEFRKGDIRNCYANINRIKDLNFEVKKDLFDGLEEMYFNSKKSKLDLLNSYNYLKNNGLIVT